MASTSQQRCVFVGNIPYDATEEQLKQICEEVGPVVSFRLVTDRETGKPKGYGFCEYKDEETALSARRNLLGYEINGRQLRVDFAENDKGSDSNRERGRGGPGMTANVDPQKQLAGPSILGDSAHQQPIGLSLATDAASKMAGALAGAQVSITANPNGLYGQAGLGGDPLTLHLAKMSRSQLNEIFSELKAMATEDKELARQLLLAHAQLPKALFQAQIMLGMVTPEMLQMPNIRQGGSFSQKLSQDGHQGRLPAFQAALGLPPLAQNKMQFGMMPKVHEAQASATPQSSLGTNQVSALPQHHTLSRVQMPNVAPIQVQQPSFPAQLPNLSARPQIHAATSSSLNQQMQVPLLQRSGRNETANPAHNRQLVNPNATFPTLLTQPPIPDPGFQMQLPPEVESALLQQVMNLTPEQLSLLPPDQQQQVMQLQQMLG